MHPPAVTAPRPDLESTVSVSTLVQIGAALVLGLVMLFGVGFAAVDVVHSAAHDARHAVAFPCH